MGKAREQSSRFAASDWVKVNDGRGQNFDSDITEIKTSMFQSRLFDYISVYIMVKGRVAAVGTDNSNVQLNQEYVQVVFKNCAPFTHCISDIHNTRVDDAKNKRKLQSGSIRISDVGFEITLEILSKLFS